VCTVENMLVVAKQAVAGRAGSIAEKESFQVCQDWSAEFDGKLLIVSTQYTPYCVSVRWWKLRALQRNHTIRAVMEIEVER
jgi:hypothetical protein